MSQLIIIVLSKNIRQNESNKHYLGHLFSVMDLNEYVVVKYKINCRVYK